MVVVAVEDTTAGLLQAHTTTPDTMGARAHDTIHGQTIDTTNVMAWDLLHQQTMATGPRHKALTADHLSPNNHDHPLRLLLRETQMIVKHCGGCLAL